MKINLRKAAAVQQIIADEIKRIGSESTTVTLSLFDDNVAARLDEQSNRVIASAQRVARLMETARYFRGVLARKNAEHGISEYLAEDAMLAQMESRVSEIARLTPRPNADTLEKEIAARRESRDEKSAAFFGRGTEYEITVNAMPIEIVNAAKSELEKLRRRRRKLQDEMITINIRNEIEVPEQFANVLVELGLD